LARLGDLQPAVPGAWRFGDLADIDSDLDRAIETGASFQSANFDCTGEEIQSPRERASEQEAQFGSSLNSKHIPLVNAEPDFPRQEGRRQARPTGD